MFLILKFGYDGRQFTGYQRGNGENSVEDSILKVMKKYDLSDGFSSAARTDRGVSAAGNVIFLNSRKEPHKTIGILNSKARNVIFHAYAEVESDFRVRFSSMKHYRYLLQEDGMDINRFSEIIGKFVGTHDFSRFSRKDQRSPIRTINDIRISKKGNFLLIDIFGPNFVWNQIRSMVGFSRYFTISGDDVEDPFRENRRRWVVARPEPLILMDIEYRGVEFKGCLQDKKGQIWENRIMDLRTHALTMENILSVAEQNGNISTDQVY